MEVTVKKYAQEKITAKQMYLLNKLLINGIMEIYKQIKDDEYVKIEFEPKGNTEKTYFVEYDVLSLCVYPSTPKNLASSLIDVIQEKLGHRFHIYKK